jgi:murein DD-endopeptidase MepM/ murein hydrolase activator NlpD
LVENKKITLGQRLREKYRISVLNEKTLTEQWHLHLSGWGVIVVVGAMFLIALALFSLVILYTPIRNYLPGYSENIRQQLIEESARLDSMGTSLEMQRQYLDIIKQVVAGEMQSDTVHSLDSMQIIMREQLLEAKNEATAEYIAQYEAMGKDNMQLFSGNRATNAPTMAFFTPVHGSVISQFSLQEKRYGITIQTLENKNVNAVLNGTVIYLNHEINDVYTVIIKHTNYLSIYRGLKKSLKNPGQVVQTGECIGLTADKNIEFELWKDEQAVDPEQLIVF